MSIPPYDPAFSQRVNADPKVREARDLAERAVALLLNAGYDGMRLGLSGGALLVGRAAGPDFDWGALSKLRKLAP